MIGSYTKNGIPTEVVLQEIRTGWVLHIYWNKSRQRGIFFVSLKRWYYWGAEMVLEIVVWIFFAYMRVSKMVAFIGYSAYILSRRETRWHTRSIIR